MENDPVKPLGIPHHHLSPALPFAFLLRVLRRPFTAMPLVLEGNGLARVSFQTVNVFAFVLAPATRLRRRARGPNQAQTN